MAIFTNVISCLFDRIKAIFEARKAFTEVENSARLKKALKVKPQKIDFYQTGDRLFYKFGLEALDFNFDLY